MAVTLFTTSLLMAIATQPSWAGCNDEFQQARDMQASADQISNNLRSQKRQANREANDQLQRAFSCARQEQQNAPADPYLNFKSPLG
jgi:uncharacterized membrane protein